MLNELPILSVDEVIERIDAVDDRATLRELAGELFAPERLSVAGVGPDEEAFRAAIAPLCERVAEARMIRVAVAGAAGRMGETVCARGRGRRGHGARRPRRPAARRSTLEDVLDATPRSSSTSPSPTPRSERPARACAPGVHVVIGTTGFDPAPLAPGATRRRASRSANVLIAPNFAIGAVLMMRFAAEAARHMAKAEIIELHHDGKLDAPSGTAARTAELMAAGERRRARRRSTRCACPGSSPTRR